MDFGKLPATAVSTTISFLAAAVEVVVGWLFAAGLAK